MSVCLFFDIKIDLTEESCEQENREGSVVNERRGLWLSRDARDNEGGIFKSASQRKER